MHQVWPLWIFWRYPKRYLQAKLRTLTAKGFQQPQLTHPDRIYLNSMMTLTLLKITRRFVLLFVGMLLSLSVHAAEPIIPPPPDIAATSFLLKNAPP